MTVPTRNLGAQCTSDEQLPWPNIPGGPSPVLPLERIPEAGKCLHWLEWLWPQLEAWPQPHGLEYDRE